MITKIEHKEVLNIVEKYGGDNKVDLRNSILRLLKNKENRIKTKISNIIKYYDD